MNKDEKVDQGSLAPYYHAREPLTGENTDNQDNQDNQNNKNPNEINRNALENSVVPPASQDTSRDNWHARRITQLRRRVTTAGVIILALILLLVRVFNKKSVVAPVPLLDKDWVTVSLLPENPYSRPGIALTKINAIVVHYVGNAGTTAEQNRSYFAGLATSGATYASSHFIIGMDGEVIQCVPMDEIAYCSNDRNYDTLSIECCHPYEDGAFTSETYSSLIRLLRTLCQMYDLDEDDIIRHYDVTGKACPLYYVNHEDAWEQLKADVFDSSFAF